MSDVETIVRIAARGDGVTESGRHAPLAAPGDGLAIDGSLIPGPHHATPPCRHFPECGGCQLQHVDDAAYADFIVARITDALRAQRIDAPDIRAPHLSPPATRRRATLAIERAGRVTRIGFHEGQGHRIVDMAECHVLDPRLFALVAPLRRLLAPLLADRVPATAQVTIADQGIDLNLAGIRPEGLAQVEALTAFAAGHGLARLTVDDGYGPEARWEPVPVTVTLSGTPVGLPPGGFLQATADGEAALVAAVCTAVAGAGTVADLFAGLGTFSWPLLAVGARVMAVEGARDAALAAKAAENGRPLFVDHRDLFRRPLSTAELSRFDAIVLDPPRAGAREQTLALAGADVGAIASVSCNPATFARDAAALIAGGWRIDWVQPVGQFRWSTHVELVARFVR
ncbi:MAG: class I SAM-dependent RNA methyltransferase [Sphingomonas fennica]